MGRAGELLLYVILPLVSKDYIISLCPFHQGAASCADSVYFCQLSPCSPVRVSKKGDWTQCGNVSTRVSTQNEHVPTCEVSVWCVLVCM